MNWISTKDKLPEEGKYVLARHNRGTWNDSTDQKNVNCVVVKLVMGISKSESELMEKGELESPMVYGFSLSDGMSMLPRHKVYRSEDEDGNNILPYKWEQFGPDSFFGHTITHWTPIEPLNNRKNQ